ncbi:hypothetical protein [Arthrobacter antibioticus]|uniref:hypothetical protein n=1 Tax=Arthrobacter sp. H35-MC1 TaxID=3046203 RepID=UPI0024BB2EB3|nr:hypothetical protein [Arthrobacter sp. H35-MC1]MDJ0317112.1 hypothetical protein [Arthrobacter sp. H35-MC1]
MGNEIWVYGIAALIVLVTLGILLLGCLLLRAMARVRSWNFYFGAVGIALLVLMWAAAKVNRLIGLSAQEWDLSGPVSDQEDIYLSLFLNGSLFAIAAVFIGGLLLGLLGWTAARDRHQLQEHSEEARAG